MIVVVEVLKSSSDNVTNAVFKVCLVLCIQVGCQPKVGAVEIVDAPSVCSTYGLYLGVNQILVGYNLFVAIGTVVQSKSTL